MRKKKKSGKKPSVKQVKPQPTGKRGWRKSKPVRAALRMAPAAITIPAWLMARLPKTKKAIKKDLDALVLERMDFGFRELKDFTGDLEVWIKNQERAQKLFSDFVSAGFFDREGMVKRHGPKGAPEILERIDGVLSEINQELHKVGMSVKNYKFGFSLEKGLEFRFDENIPRKTRVRINTILNKHERLLKKESVWVMAKTEQNLIEAIKKQAEVGTRTADSGQAYVVDARAGTYKDIVRAAEKCTAGVIHPGTPFNPNEKDLDKLVRRAEKYQ